MNQQMPNISYEKGANLFTRFRLIILDGQARATPEFNDWLAQLRDTTVEYPVTDEWFDQLTVLSKEDFECKEIDWEDTTMVISGNAERFAFFEEIMNIWCQNSAACIVLGLSGTYWKRTVCNTWS